MKTEYQLPAVLAPVIRGEGNCSGDEMRIVETGKLFYQDGKDGLPYSVSDIPAGISHAAAEYVERFLRACWELGQSDSVSNA